MDAVRGPFLTDSNVDIASTSLPGINERWATISITDTVPAPEAAIKLKLETHSLAGGRSRYVPSRSASFHFRAPRSEGVSEGGPPS